jgi:hypothetical protein
MSDSGKLLCTGNLLARLFGAAERHRAMLWSSLLLVVIPAGMLGFLSILFWVYGVEG